MNDRAEWWDLFLSASGRTARGPFLIASAFLLGFAILYEATGMTIHLLRHGLAGLSASVVLRDLRAVQEAARSRPIGLVGRLGACCR